MMTRVAGNHHVFVFDVYNSHSLDMVLQGEHSAPGFLKRCFCKSIFNSTFFNTIRPPRLSDFTSMHAPRFFTASVAKHLLCIGVVKCPFLPLNHPSQPMALHTLAVAFLQADSWLQSGALLMDHGSHMYTPHVSGLLQEPKWACPQALQPTLSLPKEGNSDQTPFPLH